MRVYIGPYDHWFQPSRWLKNWILRWYGFDYRVDWDEIEKKKPNALDELDALEDWIKSQWYYERLKAIENWVNNRYERKIQVRIDHCDTWGADHTLAVIAVPLLKALKDKKPGAPHVDDADVPEELRSTAAPPLPEEQFSSTDENWHPRWEWVFNEMIWALEQVADDSSDDQFFTHYNEPESPGSVFNKCDMDKEGYEKWQARKQRGLMLFGKYFEALWD